MQFQQIKLQKHYSHCQWNQYHKDSIKSVKMHKYVAAILAPVNWE
jgi:hypothetical protein